jgi:hypothetical protein
MASLAWTLKAWSALWLPETGRWKARRRASNSRQAGIDGKMVYSGDRLRKRQ